MSRNKTVAIALDSEFLKTRGHVFASSVAFVPFSSRPVVLEQRQHFVNVRAATGDSSPPCALSGQRAQRRVTVFGTPIILSLNPTEVMSRADVLPCGHCLEPLLRTEFVSGETLRAIQQRHAKPVAEVPPEKNGGTSKTLTGSCAAHGEFDLLCPYSIPNIRCVDKTWLRALHAAPVGSNDFREAAVRLNYLRSYGRGRRKERSVSFLLRQYPELLQDVLRESFATAEAWCDWLKMCGDIVEKELHRVTSEHRQLSSSSSSIWPPSAITPHGAEDNAVQLKICENLEEFSRELNSLWCSLMRLGARACDSGAKFYAYGNIDAKAIQNTLRWASKQPHGSEKAFLMESEGEELAAQSPPLLRERLSSPFGAKVLDITRHPLFAASGFRASPDSIPALGNALKKAAAVDDVAARLRAKSDHHNPVWDAKALACIGTACGIGLG